MRVVGDLVYVSPFAEMPGLRPHIHNFHHRLEPNVLLQAQGIVVVGRCLRFNLERRDRARRVQSAADQVKQIVDIAETD